MVTEKQYEDYHKELIEIWNNRIEGRFDGRGCPACVVATLKLRENDYVKKKTCDCCPLPKTVCINQTSHFNKYTEARRPSSKKKHATLIRDAKWMEYKDWIKL